MKFFNWLSEQIFPENYTCEICGCEIFDGKRLCAECAKTVTFNDGETCPVCGRKTESSSLCLECKALAPSYEKAVSAIVYKDGGAKLVHKFKNGGAYLKEYFADLLKDKCECFTDADCICFVPMTSKAERNRGYNQAELLAKSLSERLNIPLLKDGLSKVKATEPQKSLKRYERENNLKGCFKAERKAVKDKTILLIDDVLTTGATAEMICTELKRKGAKKVYLATVASVEYKASNKETSKSGRD